MRLAQLLVPLGVDSVPGADEVEVKGLTCDSRQVRPGDLFVAIRGENVDAHRFVADAVDRGAVAVVAEEPVPVPASVPVVVVPDSRWALSALAASFYGDPSRRLRLVGVTGTNGKTTVSFLVMQLAAQLGVSAGVIGTAGVMVGDEVVEPKSGYTTPEAHNLHRLLRRMVERGVEVVAMEVSSHALEQERVAHCRFVAAAFTNLTHEHLDYHRDMEGYYRAKRLLFQQLEPGATAVVNLDDPYGQRLVAELPQGVRLVTYGLENPAAQLQARDAEITPEMGVRFRLVSPWGEWPVSAPGLFGIYNVSNALAALGCGLALGLPLEAMVEAMAGVRPAPGRFQRVDLGQDFTVVVDYAHTPDGFEKLLSSVQAVRRPGSRLILVFGSAGLRDRTKRPEMGRVAGRYGDILVLTEEDPRTEDPRAIMDEIAAGVDNPRCTIYRIEDRLEAIETAIQLAQPGDMVLILGKGNETDLEVQHPTRWHGDVPAAEAALLRRLAATRTAPAGRG
ncbi:MAG: UDP-N-acetylmuramoyl-L-alanyl-D-glutamate--2,6-diaminopimelate ligase [Bacillota bacterium]